MNLHIYTNDSTLSETIRNHTKKVLTGLRCDAKVYTYITPEPVTDLLLGRPKEVDILMIDLNSSVELEKTLHTFRLSNLEAGIFLFSDSYQKLNTLLLLRPSAYLLKPLDSTLFSSSLYHALKELRRYSVYFPVKINNCLERIPYQNIDYFESNQRNIHMHLNHRNIIHSFIAKLDEVERRLTNANFVRCHQSYLVNMDNIRKIDKANRQITFFSGNTVEISKRLLGQTVDSFLMVAGISHL